jgi:uncharacterized protein RhaS with RHS repeats
MLIQAITELSVAYLRILEQKGKIEIKRENGKVTIRRKDEGRNLCKVFNSEAGQEEH